jgi:hypothetical protein
MIATVSMNKTLPNPYYLFSFQHIASKERVSFYPQVITSNVRYDKFRFVEAPTTNLSLTPPQVFFEYLGQYYYSIYENITSGSTDISLAYNKLESGRAWVIVGDDNTQECFFEPYISNDEDFSQVIYVSEQEEACIYPTPSITPSPTGTPITPSPTPTITFTPTPSSTPPVLPPIQFLVHYGPSQNSACNGTPNTFIYAADLGNCAPCLPQTCWACLSTSQQLFVDANLTTPVSNGYYKNEMAAGVSATWHVIGGYPQGGGFMGCP